MKILTSNPITKFELSYLFLFVGLLYLGAVFHPILENFSIGLGTNTLVFGAYAYFVVAIIRRSLVFPSFVLWRYKYRGGRAIFLSIIILIMLTFVLFVNNFNFGGVNWTNIIALSSAFIYALILREVASRTAKNYEIVGSDQ